MDGVRFGHSLKASSTTWNASRSSPGAYPRTAYPSGIGCAVTVAPSGSSSTHDVQATWYPSRSSIRSPSLPDGTGIPTRDPP